MIKKYTETFPILIGNTQKCYQHVQGLGYASGIVAELIFMAPKTWKPNQLTVR